MKKQMSRLLGRNFAKNLSAEQNSPSASESKTIPRREQRAATRERLIQATIDLLRAGGVSAVSTVSVTREAGIAQSGFYMHFKNIDEALRVAAERVAEQIGNYVAETRREMHRLDPDDLNLLREHCEKMLELFLKEQNFTEIFLRHRHDKTSLGEVLRELAVQLHFDLVEDLRNVIFQQRKIPKDWLEQISLQADIILAAAMTTGEALIEKRVSDIKTAANLLAINIMAATNAAFLGSE